MFGFAIEVDDGYLFDLDLEFAPALLAVFIGFGGDRSNRFFFSRCFVTGFGLVFRFARLLALAHPLALVTSDLGVLPRNPLLPLFQDHFLLFGDVAEK